ncbi:MULTISPECIES: Gfo/Idh/MocA family protein [unclassified Mycolicibacterium]|uniref:Gfo/Idh/MocA family protein n=1 Tax=unclassified Mycolicibacterium TaxID=2636767 RepID=UPI0012DF7C89|nr:MULTISPECIES: Gfo/Idh/MocA family oxidoreductase [unclassified Mycolicibacterium]
MGLIGLGEVGHIHAEAIQKSQSSRLVAVADANPSLLAPYAEAGIRCYNDAADLINDPDIKTVSLCLPHHLHFSVAMSAIAAGKNLLVEKPLAITVAECEELVAAARRAGVTLGVQHNQVFYSAHVEAKRMIEAGQIGRPVLLRLRLGMGPVFGGWRTSVANSGGGLLFDAGVHRIYMTQFLFGPVVSCHTILDAPREQGETFAVIVLQFASGARGIIEANHHGPAGVFDDEIEIVGTDAVLRLPGLESELSQRDSMTVFTDGAWKQVPIDDDNWETTVHKSVWAFLDAVAAGESAPVSGEDAVETMRLLHQIYDSAQVLDDHAGVR